jgi:hypothetical protein
VAELVQLIPHFKLEIYTLKTKEKTLAALLKQVNHPLFRSSAPT